MSKNSTPKGRILGRRVARVMTREQVASATGPVHVGPPTWTFTDPPDRDNAESDL